MRTRLVVAAVPAALFIAASVLNGQQPPPKVPCKDGTVDSTGHKSPCGKHGGVKSPSRGAVAVNAPPPQGAVKVNTPPGPTSAPAGVSHSAAPKASGAGGIIGPSDNKIVSPTDSKLKTPSGSGGIGTSTAEAKFAPPPATKINAPPASSGGGIGGSTAEVKMRSPDATVNSKAAGATAKCKDGTYSHTTNTKIMCSGHSGVGQGLGQTTSH